MKKKLYLILLCGIILFGVCGCDSGGSGYETQIRSCVNSGCKWNALHKTCSCN